MKNNSIKNMILLALFIIILLVGVSCVMAAPTLVTLRLDEPDNFYSSCAGNNIINIRANVTWAGTLFNQIYVNFTGTGISCGVDGILNLTNTTSGYSEIYNASCDVTLLANTSDFNDKTIQIVAADDTGGTGSALVVIYTI